MSLGTKVDQLRPPPCTGMAFPLGRVGTREFYKITGICKTIFFDRYRWDPAWQEHLDIRVDSAGRLHMDEEAVHALARDLIEQDGGRESHLAERLRVQCACGDASAWSVRVCPGCGDDLLRQ